MSGSVAHADPMPSNSNDNNGDHNNNDSEPVYTEPNRALRTMAGIKRGQPNPALAPAKKLRNQAQHEQQHQHQEEFDDDGFGYEKISKIGEGTYGVVYKARHKATNKIVALKKIRLVSSEGIPVTALREIALLKGLRHEHLLGLSDLLMKDTSVYLVNDFFNMDLRRYMLNTGRPGMTKQHIKSFMHQLLLGLHYCHANRILHRDLKPQNLLIDNTGRLVLADLGLARAFCVPMRTYTHQVITLWYRPPEILLGSKHYSTAVDLWSVGCIFAEMLTMKPLFPGESQIDQLFCIFRILGTPTEERWPGVSTLPDFGVAFPAWKPKDLQKYFARYPDSVKDIDHHAFDLLYKLLDYDPCYRISAKKALEHPYFFTDINAIQM